MRPLLFLLAMFALPHAAAAASSNVVAADGARIRLVSAGLPGPDGNLAAVLEIALDPGWKTYWIDPGEAGVPPSLTLADGSASPLRLPHPSLIDEGDVQLVGYNSSTRFVATLPAAASPVEADVFIGVCEKICVPVSGRLTLDPASDPDNPRDAAIVEEALAALPRQPGETFSAKAIGIGSDTLTVDALAPAEAAEAALYVASAEGWVAGLATPATVVDGRASFAVPVSRDSETPWPAEGLLYVLVADGRAVEGRLTPP